MVSPINYDFEKTEPQPGPLVASRIAIISFFRGLPFFISRRPRTPLRVFCIMALDTVHVFRYARRMPSDTLQNLALLLDFGASANDFFDKNGFSREEHRATRWLLERSEANVAIDEYMRRLRHLENRRPLLSGDSLQHRKAQTYRESVIRLSLGMVAATALNNLTIEDGIQATHGDEDLEMLYRIVMLCQIIDDVLDFAKDTRDGLPSFLTAHVSPVQALILTSEAATRYADLVSLPSSPYLFPFRLALLVMLILTKVAIMLGRWRLSLSALRNRIASITDRHASTDAHS